MNSLELEYLCSRDSLISRQFLGVFPCDKLPIPLFPCCFIANTAEEQSTGEHWVAIAFDYQGNALYFCSYGHPPKPVFLVYLQPYSWWRTNRRIQGLLTTCCGHYCVAFLHFHCRHVSMRDFLSLFTARDNDDIVVCFVNSLFNFTSPVIDKSFLKKIKN